MKQKLKLFAATLAFTALSVAAFTVPTSAIDPLQDTCNSSGSGSNPICQNQGDSVDSLVGTIVNVLLFVIGAIAVVMLIWGGIRYTTSAGNSASVTAAKNTILYSIVGLVIAFLAFAIVNWVFRLF
jgi:hypothetical protein